MDVFKGYSFFKVQRSWRNKVCAGWGLLNIDVITLRIEDTTTFGHILGFFFFLNYHFSEKARSSYVLLLLFSF